MYKLLVVDDEEEVRQGLIQKLERWGHSSTINKTQIVEKCPQIAL